MNRQLRKFKKPYCSIAQQIQILEERGLVIRDRGVAEAALRHMGYYRLSSYAWPYRQTDPKTREHSFPPGCSLEHLLALSRYDTRVREALMSALGVLEVDFRSRFSDYLGETYGPFGHLDTANFNQPKPRQIPPGTRPPRQLPTHNDWLKKVRHQASRSSEEFSLHYRNVYEGFPDLPVWMTLELLTFGSLSKLFQIMRKPDQRAIANRYNLSEALFESWLHHLTYVRNLCAHQARVWDREWSIAPTPGHAGFWQPDRVPDYRRPFPTLLIVAFLLQKAIPDADETSLWTSTARKLIEDHPMPHERLLRTGVPDNWKDHPLLKQTIGIAL